VQRRDRRESETKKHLAEDGPLFIGEADRVSVDFSDSEFDRP